MQGSNMEPPMDPELEAQVRTCVRAYMHAFGETHSRNDLLLIIGVHMIQNLHIVHECHLHM